MIFSIEVLVCLYFSVPIFILVFIFFTSILIFYIIINSIISYIRQKKENQLETFLIDLVGNLYGNPNILVSIRKSIEKTNSPLKSDLQIILDDCAKGILLKDALKNMINRNKSNLIEIVLMGIIAANEKGVDLVTFLNYQIEYLREKKSLNNYIKILSTGPKYTSYFIMIIPLISIFAVLLLNRNFISLYIEGIGLIVIIYSVASYIIGFLLINKIINNLNKSMLST
ncbi:MAG: type II secretion system F family protein [Actinobacteria bacterium]|nr:type II secretion system F family protein [Actinomycetota bacterium]